MHHRYRSDQSCGNTPRILPWQLLPSLLVEERDAESFCKILPQVMGSAHLQHFSIWHYCFDACRVESSRELLAICLFSCENCDCENLFAELLIFLQIAPCFCIAFFLC